MPRAIPKKVKSLTLTITPIDFHAGAKDAPLHHGLIGLWARSMTPTTSTGLIEANGNLPGELMSFVFSMMTPVNALTKYNLGLFDVMDDEKKLLNFLRMEKWLADRPTIPGEAGQAVAEGPLPGQPDGEGRVQARRHQVDLKKIDMPVLNVFAEEDHIIPPKSTPGLRTSSARRTTPSCRCPAARGRIRERQVAGHPGQEHLRLAEEES
jgi:polyhydroxyalkanoate synthase